MPKCFAETRRQVDRVGVVREWSEVVIGQSWDKGTVVLYWNDMEAPDWADGFNEVIYWPFPLIPGIGLRAVYSHLLLAKLSQFKDLTGKRRIDNLHGKYTGLTTNCAALRR